MIKYLITILLVLSPTVIAQNIVNSNKIKSNKMNTNIPTISDFPQVKKTLLLGNILLVNHIWSHLAVCDLDRIIFKHF